MLVRKVSTIPAQDTEMHYNKDIGGKPTDFHSYKQLFSNMRKIESQMNSAIRSNTNFSKANTQVTWEDRIANVYLHGNLIARVGDTFVQIFDGGWQSNTTKSRLNALLDEVSYGCRVFQKDWTWYLSGNNIGTVPFFSGMQVK